MPSSPEVGSARRLLLVRHGRSAHVHAGWIDATGFRAWRVAYEAASIRDDERVPPDLQQLAAGADLVVASDAPRAVASARLLAPPGKEVVVSPLLRELELEGPSMGGLRLPLAAWALAVGGQILLRTLRRQHPSAAEVARVAQAVAWLDDLAARHSTILAVTHASVRGQLSRHLARTTWNPEPGRRSLRPWSAWRFRSFAPTTRVAGDALGARVRASAADLRPVYSLLEEASAWLRARGSDQWNPAYPIERFARDISTGHVWFWLVEGEVAATVTITSARPDYYPPGVWDDGTPAWYIARLAVARRLSGRSLGVVVLEQLERAARAEGIRVLRLDVTASSPFLAEYYLARGFTRSSVAEIHRAPAVFLEKVLVPIA